MRAFGNQVDRGDLEASVFLQGRASCRHGLLGAGNVFTHHAEGVVVLAKEHAAIANVFHGVIHISDLLWRAFAARNQTVLLQCQRRNAFAFAGEAETLGFNEFVITEEQCIVHARLGHRGVIKQIQIANIGALAGVIHLDDAVVIARKNTRIAQVVVNRSFLQRHILKYAGQQVFVKRQGGGNGDDRSRCCFALECFKTLTAELGHAGRYLRADRLKAFMGASVKFQHRCCAARSHTAQCASSADRGAQNNREIEFVLQHGLLAQTIPILVVEVLGERAGE